MPEVPPELEWGLVAPAHRHIGKRLQENNWAQGVEGGIEFQPRRHPAQPAGPYKAGMPFRERQRAINPKVGYLATDTAPRFFVRPTDYGMRIGARRVASDTEYYWRITQFLLPFYTMIARPTPTAPSPATPGRRSTTTTPGPSPCTGTRTQPLGDISEFDYTKVNVAVVPDGSYRPIHEPQQRLRHRPRACSAGTAQRHRGIGLQDSAMQETMGAIVDRTKEKLGSGDTAIVAWRRLMLEQARRLRDTGECTPPLARSLPHALRRHHPAARDRLRRGRARRCASPDPHRRRCGRRG